MASRSFVAPEWKPRVQNLRTPLATAARLDPDECGNALDYISQAFRLLDDMARHARSERLGFDALFSHCWFLQW